MLNKKSDTGMLLWHPKIHEYFNESLFYVALRFKGYRREFSRKVREHLISEGIVGICVYEILGSYDVLIRAWLTSAMLTVLTTRLDNTTSLAYYHVFRVKNMRHWGFIEPPNEELLHDLLNQLDIEKAQSDAKLGRFKLVQPYLDGRLAVYRDENYMVKDSTKDSVKDNGRVKFYSALTFGEFGVITKRQEDEICETLTKIQDNVIKAENHSISDFSLYFGEGLAHVFIKGIAGNIVTARNFVVEDVIEPLRASFPETTTFAICEEKPFESDDISVDALQTFQRGTPPLWITNWFPDFYNLGGSKAVVTKVQNLLMENEDIIRNLPQERLVNLLKPLLESAITENPEQAVREILFWFSSVEANLGSDSIWFSFLRTITGQGGEAVRHISHEIEKSVRMKNRDSQTLVDLLDKYVWALKKYRPESHLLTPRTPTGELAEIRNIFAHGKIFSSFSRVWERFFNLIMWFLPLYEGILIVAKIDVKDKDINK